jgi:hypothetical protein
MKQDLISSMFLDWVVLPQLSGDAHFDRWGQKDDLSVQGSTSDQRQGLLA